MKVHRLSARKFIMALGCLTVLAVAGPVHLLPVVVFCGLLITVARLADWREKRRGQT